jgi:hypothetical protein
VNRIKIVTTLLPVFLGVIFFNSSLGYTGENHYVERMSECGTHLVRGKMRQGRLNLVHGMCPSRVKLGESYECNFSDLLNYDAKNNQADIHAVYTSKSWLKYHKCKGFSGTPTKTDLGRMEFRLRVSRNNIYEMWSAGIIVHDNHPPVFRSFPQEVATIGEEYSFQPTIFDQNGDKIGFDAVGIPKWAIFDKSTGLLSGIPNKSGIWDTVRITAYDITPYGFKTYTSINFRIQVSPSYILK